MPTVMCVNKEFVKIPEQAHVRANSVSAIKYCSVMLYLNLALYFRFFTFRYLRQVIDETLRVSVLAPFGGRVSLDREWTVGGHVIPKATPIVVALGVALHDEETFPDPDKSEPTLDR